MNTMWMALTRAAQRLLIWASMEDRVAPEALIPTAVRGGYLD